MHLSTTEIKNVINDVEERFPVETWVLEDIHIWFLVRLSMYFRLFYHGRDTRAAQRTLLSWPAKAMRAIDILRDPPKRWLAMLSDRKHSLLSNTSCDVLLLSYSFHRVLLDGVWYDKYCDPFADAFSRIGLTSQLLEMTPHGDYRVPRYHASRYIQPAIDRSSVSSYFLSRRANAPAGLFGYADMTAELARKGLGFAVPSLFDIYRTASTIQRLVPFFERVLRNSQPSFVLIAEYYNTTAGALILACRRLGIPTIDIQHGVQGDEHVAYGSWLKHPPGGYELFPTLFWCWSRYEADAIERWNRWSQGKPRAYVGGNLWTHRWLDPDSPSLKNYDRLVASALKGREDNTMVLLTPGILSDLSDWLLDAMRDAPRHIVWWIRLHPCIMDMRPHVKDLIASRKISNYEIDLATDLPLEALLRRADVNVTAYSSTVIDAGQFGVPSIVTDRSGISLYPEQIQSGVALPALNATDFFQAIETQLVFKRTLQKQRTATSTTIGTDAIARKFLAASPGLLDSRVGRHL